MGQFDTHGGYFSPKGYMKVNEGGSHEENPNGGVQVGVDPQGIPNLLEEGEPVYNDYVFSDNIYADGGILEKHNLPKKYAGKLYSEICDKYVDEAADMPLDAIENNGLNAMLLRLADAQEEQKAIQQQKELEEELANMSPEELAELEQMLAEQEAAQQEVSMEQAQQIPQDVPPEMMQQPMPEEQMMQQVPVQQQMQAQMPMMAKGGFLKLYRAGGDTDDDQFTDALLDAIREGHKQAEIDNARTAYNNAIANEQRRAFWQRINPFSADKAYARAVKRKENLENSLLSVAKTDPGTLQNPIYNARWREAYENAKDDVKSAHGRVSKSESKTDRLKAISSSAKERLIDLGGNVYEVEPESLVDPTVPVVNSAVNMDGVSAPDTVSVPLSEFDSKILELKKKMNIRATGGKINRYDGGGWTDFLNQLAAYTWSQTPSRQVGKYRIDPNFYKRYGFNNIKALENSQAYRDFTDYVIAHQNDENVLNYLRALDAGTPDTNDVPKLFENGKLRSDWTDLYRSRRNDGLGGIYHFMGNDLAGFNTFGALARPTVDDVRRLELEDSLVDAGIDPYSFDYNAAVKRLEDDENAYVLPDGSANIDLLENEPLADDTVTLLSPYVPGSISAAIRRKGTDQPVKQQAGDSNGLPTWPRYAKALTAAGLGLYNAFQEPYPWRIPNTNPALPYGKMHLIDPTYNPLDQNKTINEVLAGNAGTARSLMASTPNSSVPSALLANDYNVGRNMGTAATSIWDANNQFRNAVTAAHNQNATALGNFQYGQSRDRANILNMDNMYDLQNALMKQRLDYADESARFNAIGNQIDAASTALMEMGNENAAYNMLPKYLYGLRRRSYLPYYLGADDDYACGGKLKKHK